MRLWPLPAIALLLTPALASATTIDYTLTGQDSATSPINTVTFSLPQDPVPADVTPDYFDVKFVSATFNGNPNDSATILFSLEPNSSSYFGFYYQGQFADISGTYTQLFTGQLATPELDTGSWTFLRSGTVAGYYTLTAVDASQSPTPEPSSLLLLATGALGATWMLRRRSAALRPTCV
jgi:hypothetical protein